MPAIELTDTQHAVLRKIFARYADRVESVGVYGSRARGGARPGADVDIVLYGAVDANTLAQIRSDLEESDLSIFADVTTLESVAHPGLRADIEKFAKLLFSQADLAASPPS